MHAMVFAFRVKRSLSLISCTRQYLIIPSQFHNNVHRFFVVNNAILNLSLSLSLSLSDSVFVSCCVHAIIFDCGSESVVISFLFHHLTQSPSFSTKNILSCPSTNVSICIGNVVKDCIDC